MKNRGVNHGKVKMAAQGEAGALYFWTVRCAPQLWLTFSPLSLAESNVLRALACRLSTAHKKLRRRLGNGQGTRAAPCDDHVMTSDVGAVERVAPP